MAGALRRFVMRLWATLTPARHERDLDEELRAHLELDVAERVRAGATPDEARRAALIALGGVEAVKEDVRAQQRLPWLADAARDLRWAARALARDRVWSAVVILSFALGVGANTAIFGAVNAVLLRPLPYPDFQRIVRLYSIDRHAGDKMPTTPADFLEWQAQARSFSALAPSTDVVYTLSGDGAAESIIGYKFAPSMFTLLGMRPQLGRVFTASDGENVVVLSDGLWRRRFHADAGIVGRSIRLDQNGYVVVGVMPPAFRHPAAATELWTPLVLGAEAANDRERPTIRALGRLRPGVSEAEARAELRTIAAQQAEAHPQTNAFRGADLVSLRASYSGDARPVLLVLLAAVAFVLVLTSSNIAGLALARAARRAREMAVRSALGAGRGRLVRQLLTESLLLSCLGGALGLLVALWGRDLLVQLFPRNVSNLDIPPVDAIPLDGAVVLFSFGVTVLAGIGAGLVPALRGSRGDLAAIIRQGGRGTTPASRLRPWLVAGQIALALTFSTAAGLTIRAAQARQRALGFVPSHVLTARVLIDRSRHADTASRRLMTTELMRRVRAAAGVRSAGVVEFLPLCGWSADVELHTAQQQGRADDKREAGLLAADAGYFTTLRIPLLAGRSFSDGDRADAPPVAIVDERFARRFFGRRDVVGERLDLGEQGKPEWHEIVGVVGDVLDDPPPSAQRPMLYLPITQHDAPFLGLVVRSDGDPAALAPLVRDALAAVDPEQPLSYVMTMPALVTDALAVERTSMLILSFFALTALVLAAMGIYGVLAQSVIERRHEIGIRVALGAQPRQVVGFMLRRLGVMAGVGLGLGVAGALAVGRMLGALSSDVPARDPLLLAVAVVLLTLVGTLAAWIPLRRALATDPMIALRDP